MSNIINRINELKESGLTLAKIKAMLTIEDYTAKEIAQGIKDAGVSIKPKTFASDYYDWLSASIRTKEEATDYILGQGEFGDTSDNTKKHRSHYLNIWELSATIWNSKESVEAEPEASSEDSERDAKIAEAWEKLARAKKSKRKVRSIHPDKVSYLNDDVLTKAYSDYFKNA